jgi:hypothetical protein
MRSAASNNKRKVKDCASSIFLQLGTISLYPFFDFAKSFLFESKGNNNHDFLIKQAAAVRGHDLIS